MSSEKKLISKTAHIHVIESKRNRRRRLGVIHKAESARIIHISDRRRIVHVAPEVELHDEGALKAGPIIPGLRRPHKRGATRGRESRVDAANESDDGRGVRDGRRDLEATNECTQDKERQKR